MENHSLTPALPCPACDDTPAEIRAKADARRSDRALTLSSTVTIIMVGAHIWFSYLGKELAVPDIVWAVILGPWMGAGGGKLVAIIERLFGRGKAP